MYSYLSSTHRLKNDPKQILGNSAENCKKVKKIQQSWAWIFPWKNSSRAATRRAIKLCAKASFLDFENKLFRFEETIFDLKSCDSYIFFQASGSCSLSNWPMAFFPWPKSHALRNPPANIKLFHFQKKNRN